MTSLDRRAFLRRAGLGSAATALVWGLPRPWAKADDELAPFQWGVASGDPLADSVILWTRVEPPETGTTRDVHWAISEHLDLSSPGAAGIVTTDEDRDWTVKVDPGGLTAGTTYYFGFTADTVDGPASIIGTTRTAPTGTGATQLRFAVVSCSSYQHGLFNVYDAIARRAVSEQIDAVLHTGDYLYEYKRASEGGYGNPDADRDHEPGHEMVSVGDYRQRHAQYKQDPDLRRLHQLVPFVCTWDDHESTNNSWREGAQNHTPGTGPGGEADWSTRKAAAFQAYAEWMPIRVTPTKTDGGAAFVDTADAFLGPRPGTTSTTEIQDPSKLPAKHLQLWRKLRYGDLADIIVLDTRLERDVELGRQGFTLDQNQIDAEDRVMLSKLQREFLLAALDDADTTWKVLCQQVIMSPWHGGGLPQLLPQLAEATDQDRPQLFFRDEGNALNPDQWDGYTAERRRVFDKIRAIRDGGRDPNVVVLTGDVHTSWAIDLTDDPHNPAAYNPVTGDGALGVEFVTPSVTSPGIVEAIAGLIPGAPDVSELEDLAVAVEAANLAGNPHVKYFDGTKHGYYMLDVSPTAVQADFFHIDTILSLDYSEQHSASYKVDAGAGNLGVANVPKAGNVPGPTPPTTQLTNRVGTGLGLEAASLPTPTVAVAGAAVAGVAKIVERRQRLAEGGDAAR